jgi:hypothetical protein
MTAVGTQIVIDLDPVSEPIAGHVHADGQTPRAFTGWTGLFAVLHAAVAEDQTEPGGSA